MKRFFKYLLVTITGTFLGIVCFILLIAAIIGGIVAFSSDSSLNLKEKSVLVIRLDEPIKEASSFNPFSNLTPFGGETSVIGLHDIINAINTAATDKNITGIVLYTSMIQAGYSSVFEIREALIKFKKSGKFIMSYGDMYSQKSYLLASVADKVCINPEGMFELSGISSQFVSFKNLLGKIGVKPIVFRAGKYKSFAESFTSERMSPENKEQVKALVGTIWKEYTASIEAKRSNISKPISTLADSLLIWNAQSSYDFGITDTLVYYDEFIDIVKKKNNTKKSDDIETVNFTDYIQHCNQIQKNTEDEPKNEIALIYAAGSINMGEGDENSIGSESLSKYIRDARKDDKIKAIVLRINSGGGSALASEAIWREMYLAAKAKPTIVSMGDVAASGGYYIAAPAHVIVANPTTITGSIGVFGMLFNSEDLFNKIGIAIDTVKTNKSSDFGSPVRPISDYESMIISKSIDKTYTVFKKRVSEGRKLSMNAVQEIAQGRVWSGVDAKKIGLVDTLGGMELAISIAAKKAKISSNYTIKNIPETKSPFDKIMDKMSGKQSFTAEIQEVLGTEFGGLYYLLQEVPREKGMYMQMPYLLKIE